MVTNLSEHTLYCMIEKLSKAVFEPEYTNVRILIGRHNHLFRASVVADGRPGAHPIRLIEWNQVEAHTRLEVLTRVYAWVEKKSSEALDKCDRDLKLNGYEDYFDIIQRKGVAIPGERNGFGRDHFFKEMPTSERRAIAATLDTDKPWPVGGMGRFERNHVVWNPDYMTEGGPLTFGAEYLENIPEAPPGYAKHLYNRPQNTNTADAAATADGHNSLRLTAERKTGDQATGPSNREAQEWNLEPVSDSNLTSVPESEVLRQAEQGLPSQRKDKGKGKVGNEAERQGRLEGPTPGPTDRAQQVNLPAASDYNLTSIPDSEPLRQAEEQPPTQRKDQRAEKAGKAAERQEVVPENEQQEAVPENDEQQAVPEIPNEPKARKKGNRKLPWQAEETKPRTPRTRGQKSEAERKGAQKKK